MHFYTFSSYINGISVMMNRWMKLLIATSEHHPPWNWQLERWTTAKVMDLLLKHLWRKSGSRFKFFRALSIRSIMVYFSQATFWIIKSSSSSRCTFLAVCRFAGISYTAVQVKHVCIVESRSPSGKLANKFHQRFPNVGNTFRAQKIRVPTKVAPCSETVWKLYSCRTYRQKSKVDPLWSSKSPGTCLHM